MIAGTDVFTGLDDIDWASMTHAYGDASNVPGLLRGLASPEPAERETALDGMLGAVHHQGDVYESTIACIPFLVALVMVEGLPGRADIVRLLRGIGGDGREIELPEPAEDGRQDDQRDGQEDWDEGGEGAGEAEEDEEDEEDEAHWLRLAARAQSEILARGGPLLGLLDDPDPALRTVLPGTLIRLHRDPEAVFAALSARLTAEPEPRVRGAVVAAVGELGVLRPGFAPRAADVLLGLLGGAAAGAEIRLTALVALAECAPARLPAHTAELAAEALRETRDALPEPAPTSVPPAGTATLVSRLRALEASRRVPWAADLLDDLHRALGDRVEVRFALLADQLRSPDRAQRLAAVDMSGLLLSGWRGPHREVVRLLGELVVQSDPRLARAAAGGLGRLHAIAGPAAGALAERIAAGPDSAAPRERHLTPYGAAVEALAAQGDARAVPGLAAAVRGGHVPEELPEWTRRMTPGVAAPLLPVLLERVAAADIGEWPETVGRLLGAAAAIGSPAATETFLQILRLPYDWTGPAKSAALDGLAAIGPAAGAALPELRAWLPALPSDLRAPAARALWALGGERAEVLAVLAEELGTGDWSRVDDALRVIAELGPDAAPLLPALRGLVAAARESGGAAGLRAVALWAAGRDPDEARPALEYAWSARPQDRPRVAAAWAAMGPAAAPAVPLLRAELARPRRHNNTSGHDRIHYHCAPDEQLLRDARTVLAACGD